MRRFKVFPAWGLAVGLSLSGCDKKETPTPSKAEAVPSKVGASETPKAGAGEAPKAPAEAPKAADPHHEHMPHEHGSPHGGTVVPSGKYHLEGVPTKMGLLVFLLDENEKELALTGVTGSMTFVADGKPPAEVALGAMGNHLHGHVTLDGKWSAAVTIDKGGEKLVARFDGEGAGVGKAHDHAAHEHLALSQEVKLELTHEGVIEVGKPVSFGFRYVDKDGQEIKDFEVVHEEKLHLFFVSDDLAQYDHVHPVLDAATGRFTHTQTFTVPGQYSVYSDFKSGRLGATLVKTPLTVPGTGGEMKPLVVDTVMERVEGELKVKLETTPSPIEANGDVMLKYTISTAAGEPVTDLEPYLGAMGHLFIIHEDLVTLAHSHPKGPEATKDMRGGPVVEFHTILPKAGKYKAWAQFQHKGKLYTLPWIVEAK